MALWWHGIPVWLFVPSRVLVSSKHRCETAVVLPSWVCSVEKTNRRTDRWWVDMAAGSGGRPFALEASVDAWNSSLGSRQSFLDVVHDCKGVGVSRISSVCGGKGVSQAVRTYGEPGKCSPWLSCWGWKGGQAGLESILGRWVFGCFWSGASVIQLALKGLRSATLLFSHMKSWDHRCVHCTSISDFGKL